MRSTIVFCIGLAVWIFIFVLVFIGSKRINKKNNIDLTKKDIDLTKDEDDKEDQ